MHSDSEPQPQPSSRIDWPSARSACSTVWRSASSSASSSVDAAPCRSRRSICGAARAPARRTPAAPRNAARWRRRRARRWRAPPCRGRTRRRCPRCRRRACVACATRAAGCAARMTTIGQRHAFGGVDDRRRSRLMSTSSISDQSAAAAERTCWYATGRRVALAARAQHLLFQRRDAGDVDQEPVHEDRRQQRAQPQGIGRATCAITG